MIDINKDTGTIKIVARDTATLAVQLDNYSLVQGDQVYFTINNEVGESTYKTQKIITDFLDGRAIINLSSEDTDLEPGDYYYDVQVNLKTGEIDTVIGPHKFKVLGGVTY